jgi:hypothetical protein
MMTAVADTFDQRRSSKRYDIAVDAEVTIGEVRHTATMRNVSLGGLYLNSAERPAMGTRVSLRFSVPTQKEPIEVISIVRWTDMLGFGVQFDGLRARDVWALSKWFEQLSS